MHVTRASSHIFPMFSSHSASGSIKWKWTYYKNRMSYHYLWLIKLIYSKLHIENRNTWDCASAYLNHMWDDNNKILWNKTIHNHISLNRLLFRCYYGSSQCCNRIHFSFYPSKHFAAFVSLKLISIFGIYVSYDKKKDD